VNSLNSRENGVFWPKIEENHRCLIKYNSMGLTGNLAPRDSFIVTTLYGPTVPPPSKCYISCMNEQMIRGHA